MTRTQLTTVITFAALGSALAVSVARSKNWTASDLDPAALVNSLQPKSQSPEDAIYAMLDAARAGNVEIYLGSYTGALRDQLNESVKESTPAGFAKYLQQTNAAIQGVALSPPEELASGEMKLRVEYVYKDRNDVQFVYLKKESAKWRIERVDGSERVKTLVPFGTAVTD